MKWLSEHEEIVRLFVKISNEYAGLYGKPFDYGSGIALSLSEIQVMEKVMEFPEMKLTELADLLGVSRAAVTKSVKKLVDKGMVEKYKRPENKKEYRMRITPAGYEAYDCYKSYVQAHLFQEVFRLLDEHEEVETVMKQFFQIVDQFYKQYDTFE